jgi:hypothetical protein
VLEYENKNIELGEVNDSALKFHSYNVSVSELVAARVPKGMVTSRLYLAASKLFYEVPFP